MEQNIEIVSEKSEDKLSIVTSKSGDDAQKAEMEELKHQSDIRMKLHSYESECKRYNLEKVEVIQKCIRENAGADVCNLDNYCIGTLQCRIMFDAFAKNPATPMTLITMKNNHIEHFCCHSISTFIQLSTTLKQLNLEGCKFGDEGATVLADAIAISKSIVCLNLANCNISDDGGEALANCFLVNDICKELNLSSNALSVKTGKAFEEVLKENKTLEKLDLSRNLLYEDNSIVKVLKGLAQNETLECLNLSWNALCGEMFGKNLTKSIKSSKLKILNLEYNRMSSFEVQKLASGLKLSQTIEEVNIAGNQLVDGDDLNLIKVFNSSSSMRLLSFGKWFHLSKNAFKLLKEIQETKPNIEVIFKDVILPNPPRTINMLDIYADRVKFLAMAPKKKLLRKDMRAFMIQLKNLPSAYLSKSDLLNMLKVFKAKLNDDLIEQYIGACIVQIDGQKKLDVHLMANHYLNRHPITSTELSNK